MKKVINCGLAKAIDSFSIEKGMPSLVLMERAALAVSNEVLRVSREVFGCLKKPRILFVSGYGNNGADAVACARILGAKGIETVLCMVGDASKATSECKTQLDIARLYPSVALKDWHRVEFDSYNIIVDGLFGVGLTREVTGNFAFVIDKINQAKSGDCHIISIDCPSGVCGDNGRVHGKAVCADTTVTFGYYKLGHIMFPGRVYSGRVVLSDCGFLPAEEIFSNQQKADGVKYLDLFAGEELFGKNHLETEAQVLKAALPPRPAYSNKGSYGRVLIIAGSKDITGAAYFSALAAYKAGAGIVTVLTHESIDAYLKSVVPEAIVKSYGDENVSEIVMAEVKKATCIVLGPGLSTDETAVKVVSACIEVATCPVIVDADALNIIAAYPGLWQKRSNAAKFIFTPHIGEMMRLTGLDKSQILADIVGCCRENARSHNVICVLKDAASIVCEPSGTGYINSSGCSAMAKGGSGDVLAGIIAAVISISGTPKAEEELYKAVCLGVYMHGFLGETAAVCGEHSVLARDLITNMKED